MRVTIFSFGFQMFYRRGFSFAEVMFSVVILGIGFIMVASVFPFAAEQTRENADQAISTQIARSAINTIQCCSAAQDFKPDGKPLHSFDESSSPQYSAWADVSGSMICKTDRQYAWTGFYGNPTADGVVQITVLVVRRQIHDAYNASDEDCGAHLDEQGQPRTTPDSALVARAVTISDVFKQADGTCIAQVQKGVAELGFDSPPPAYQAIAPGTFLIISSANDVVGNRSLRVTNLVSEDSESQNWKLDPTCTLPPGDVHSGTVNAFLIGRDFANTKTLASGYAGPAQDVAVFRTFIRPSGQ